MKDFLYKEVFNNVYNLYTEKNANDLLNENSFEVTKDTQPISSEKTKKNTKGKKLKKKKPETPITRPSEDIKKTEYQEDHEKPLAKEGSIKTSDNQGSTSFRKANSCGNLTKYYFQKEQEYCFVNDEFVRWRAFHEKEQDKRIQEMIIKNTVSKVLHNLYKSFGESENVESTIEECSKISKKSKKTKKRQERKGEQKKSGEKQKLEDNNRDFSSFQQIDEPCRKIIEINEISDKEISQRCKSFEKRNTLQISYLNLINNYANNAMTPIANNQEELNLEDNKEAEPTEKIYKPRDKSKKKKHRQKYKNNNQNKNNLKLKKEQPEIEMKKYHSVLHSTHSLPEKKGSFDQKDPSDYKKFSTKNIISKNFDMSIIGEKEKCFNSTYDNDSRSLNYFSSSSEEFRKNKSYATNYNKFNSFGSNGSSYQYFNNRNLNYNRYMDEASMVVNHYNINFNVNIMNNFNILNKIEGFYPNFYFQLHNELLDYSKNVNDINQALKEIKMFSINYVETLIKKILSITYIFDCRIPDDN